MSELKKWTKELVLCTIVAATVTLLLYVIGVDKDWNDASQTFGTTFLIMFVVGLWQRLKKN